MPKQLTKEQAQVIAEGEIRERIFGQSDKTLIEKIIELEVGWLFVPSSTLEYPGDAFFKNECVVVSRRGSIRHVPNNAYSNTKMSKFVSELNEYMKSHNE